jgi:hypothetical protein
VGAHDEGRHPGPRSRAAGHRNRAGPGGFPARRVRSCEASRKRLPLTRSLESCLFSAEAAAAPLHVLNGMPSSAYASTIQTTVETIPSSLTFMTAATAGHDGVAASRLTVASAGRGSSVPPPPLGRSSAPSPPAFPRSNTARSIPVLRPLPTVPDVDGLPGSRPNSLVMPSSPQTTPEKPVRPALPARPILPSMATLEKAAAACIFFGAKPSSS